VEKERRQWKRGMVEKWRRKSSVAVEKRGGGEEEAAGRKANLRSGTRE